MPQVSWNSCRRMLAGRARLWYPARLMQQVDVKEMEAAMLRLTPLIAATTLGLGRDGLASSFLAIKPRAVSTGTQSKTKGSSVEHCDRLPDGGRHD